MKEEKLIFLCLFLFASLVKPIPVSAANLEVCPSGCTYNSIQAAIGDANAGDTVLVGEGTYKESIDFGGKAVTLRAISGPKVTIIDGENSRRVFSFVSGETQNTIVEGFTIRGGYAVDGGGIYCYHSSPTIINCVITDNTGRYGNGGGIYCERSVPRIIKCRIVSNTAFNGGGMYLLESFPEVNDSVISGNSASIDGGGGGVHCDGASRPVFTNCLLAGNTAMYGGAIDCRNGSKCTLRACTVSGNRASGYGGGVYCSDSEIHVFSSIIWGNTVGEVPDAYYLDCGGIVWPASNIEGKINSLNVQPLFVNPRPASEAPTTEGDYHLQAASPCRDSGSAIWSADSDFDGESRPFGSHYDIGFDEYSPRGDWNDDGKPDILWRHLTGGSNALWFMDGDSPEGSDGLPSVQDTSWHIAGSAHFDSEGSQDILWRNQVTGANYIWYMNGADYIGGTRLPSAATEWEAAAVADFNDDGRPDILWSNSSNGSYYIWYLDGASILGLEPLGTGEPGSRIAGAADFDNDGRTDIVWRHTVTGRIVIWYMYGLTKVSDEELGLVPDQNWQVGALSDFDGDGDPDILWRNYDSGANHLWYLDGAHPADSSSVAPVADTDWCIED